MGIIEMQIQQENIKKVKRNIRINIFIYGEKNYGGTHAEIRADFSAYAHSDIFHSKNLFQLNLL